MFLIIYSPDGTNVDDTKVGTVENHGKNGKKHRTLLRKSQKSRQNHGSLYSC